MKTLKGPYVYTHTALKLNKGPSRCMMCGTQHCLPSEGGEEGLQGLSRQLERRLKAKRAGDTITFDQSAESDGHISVFSRILNKKRLPTHSISKWTSKWVELEARIGPKYLFWDHMILPRLELSPSSPTDSQTRHKDMVPGLRWCN